MRRVLLVLVLALAGCAAQRTLRSADRALSQAAVAEKKLGDSGAQALMGVATVTSRTTETMEQLTGTLAAVRSSVVTLQPAMAEVAGILSDVHASTTILRGKVEQPIPTWVYWGFGALGAGLFVVFAHNHWTAKKHKKLILDLHETIRKKS